MSQQWNHLLAQGKTHGSTLIAHQLNLTIAPFRNTYEADAVSPEVAIGSCKTQVSTTRGNIKQIQGNNNTQSPNYYLSSLNLLHELYFRSNTISQ